MIRKSIVWVFAVVFVLAAGSTYASWYQILYFGDEPPDSAGSCGRFDGQLYQFVPWTQAGGTIVNMGWLEDDPDAIDGKAWHIVDDRTDANDVWRTQPTVNIDSDTGATVVARVKTLSETSGAGNVGIIEGASITGDYHWGGPTGHIRESYRGAETTVAGDTGYHILRLTTKGNNTKTVPYLETFAYPDGLLVGQGDWFGNAGAEIVMENGSVKVNGGANTATARQDVQCDPDAEGKFTVQFKCKRGTIGAEGWVFEIAFCDSTSTDTTDGPVMGGWMGTSTRVKGRVGNNATPEVDIPADGSWVELKAVVDVSTNTAEYFANGQSIGTLPFIANNKLKRFKLDRKNDGRAAGQSVCLDDLEINGVPVPGRRVRLYIDEQPVPVIDIQNASRMGFSPDSFMIGSGTSSGLQDVVFDYVVGTNAGAFAPGEELAVLGYPLPLQPTAATTVQDAKKAAPNQEVILTDVIVTGTFFDFDSQGSIMPSGFAVEDDDDRSNGAYGIRVVSDFAAYPGEVVTIYGNVVVQNGEPVLMARSVTETGFSMTTLPPLGMTNKSTGGTVAPASYTETFAYSDGALGGRGGWLGSVDPQIAVSDGKLRINGGWDEKEVVQWLNVAGGSTCEVTMNIQKGLGPDNYWEFYVRDASDVELAKWYGSGERLRGRVGIPVTPEQILSGGSDQLKVVIAASDTAFYFNNSFIGSIPHAASSGPAKLVFKRIDRGLPTSYVYFDNLSVTSDSKDYGVNTLGLYTTIWGKVTGSYMGDETGLWSGYCYYVDDGSGLYDGNPEGFLGIRCRPALSPAVMPWEGTTVAVTGVMGTTAANGRVARYFWTTDYREQAQ